MRDIINPRPRSYAVEFWRDGKLVSSYLTEPTMYSEWAVLAQERRQAARHLASHMCKDVTSENYRKLYKRYYNYFEIRVYDPEEVKELKNWMHDNFNDKDKERNDSNGS